MAAAKPKAYRVKGAVAVIRKDGHERYIDRGGVFPADALDEANAEHLLAAGLIEVFELPEVVDEAKSEAYKAAANAAAAEKAAADKAAADAKK
ncbi:hypothetical protein [Cryobacterium sp. Hh11]|uniref:hypothetical protein n=1 Tax=Cryobacterium sp. Hh11 TaxID=2555868 RepID=UPI0015836CD3|nr:hypothetical protein [Cryobacterium sp. Hh11]